MAEPLTRDEMPNDLGQLLIQSYGIDPRVTSSIFNGDEAQVWKVDGGGRVMVVHIGPAWRRRDELAWVHKVIQFASAVVPESVGPIASNSGGTFIEWEGALVAVYPFVEGASLDRTDEAEVSEAGRVLGQLHAQLLNFDKGDRPEPSEGAPRPRAAEGEPEELRDPALNRWQEDVADRDWTVGVIHGDYYRRNLLCRNHEIEGIIDWHEARRAPLISEIAFAAWEMAHDDRMTYLPRIAKVFTDAYKQTGPLQRWEYDSLIPWMRLGLRENIRYGLELARLGGHSDPDYVAMQVKALRALGETRG